MTKSVASNNGTDAAAHRPDAESEKSGHKPTKAGPQVMWNILRVAVDGTIFLLVSKCHKPIHSPTAVNVKPVAVRSAKLILDESTPPRDDAKPSVIIVLTLFSLELFLKLPVKWKPGVTGLTAKLVVFDKNRGGINEDGRGEEARHWRDA